MKLFGEFKYSGTVIIAYQIILGMVVEMTSVLVNASYSLSE